MSIGYKANREFRSLVDRLTKPTLQQLGFARIGMAPTWNRAADELVHVLSLQIARPRKANHVEFTVNWSIGVPGLAPAVWGRPDPEPFANDGIAASGRPASLRTNPSTEWWDLRADVDTQDLELKVRRQIISVAGVLEDLTSRDGLFQWLLSRRDSRDRLIFPPSDFRYLEVLAGLAVLQGSPDAARWVQDLDDALNALPPKLRPGDQALKNLRRALAP
jgi:hypothetical protein